jgi:uncharacterized protein YjbI with pentapeptide repeats
MDFRRFGDKRSLQRPVIDADDLGTGEPAWNGELTVSDTRVEGGDFTGLDGEGEIERSVLTAVDLSGSRLRPLVLADVELSGADVSNALWSQTIARRAEVLSCRATGWRLSLDLALDMYVGDTRLDYAAIKVNRVKGLLVFERCSFANAQLGGDLSRVLFVDCDLAGAEFTATAARDCDLRTSRIADARGIATLRGALVTTDQVIAVADQLAREAGLTIT